MYPQTLSCYENTVLLLRPRERLRSIVMSASVCPTGYLRNHTRDTNFRSSPGDDLIDWNSGVSVRPSVRTSTKSFSAFDLIWCAGRSRPHMRISATLTRSKVKVKVTELPKLRRLHFSTSISSALKLKTDG